MSAAGTSVCTCVTFCPVIFFKTSSLTFRPHVRDMMMLHAHAQRAYVYSAGEKISGKRVNNLGITST